MHLTVMAGLHVCRSRRKEVAYMMRFTVLFRGFGFCGSNGISVFGSEKYLNVLGAEESCKVTGLMFS